MTGTVRTFTLDRTGERAWNRLLSALLELTEAVPCTQAANDAYFAPDRYTQTLMARQCRGCPVIEQCADFALRSHQAFGVWGGMTEWDRDPHKQGVGLVGRPNAAQLARLEALELDDPQAEAS